MELSFDSSAASKSVKSGVARIKPEFIVSGHERKLTLECISEEDKKKLLNIDKNENQNESGESNAVADGPTADKKPRLSKSEKKKLRGQNKARPLPFKFEREKNLCRALIDAGEDNVVTRCGNERCMFIHNVSEYLAIKPPDVGPTCYVYSLRGHCERGITCRFGSKHINSVGRNIINTTLYEKYQSGGLTTINAIKKELQHDLRKWKYSFAKSQNVIDKHDVGKNKNKVAQIQCSEHSKDDIRGKGRKRRASEAEQKDALTTLDKARNCRPTIADISEEQIDKAEIETTIKIEDNGNVTKDKVMSPIETTIEDNGNNVKEDEVILSKGLTNSIKKEEKLGPVSDHDIIVMKPREKVVIDWKDKLYLSPLTTVGNLPFRRICKEFGVDITCGEMAMANPLLRGMPQEWALMKRHTSEDLFGVQLCGNNPYVMTKCAQLLEEQTVIDFIDVNLGCPIDFVYQRGEGSGLLQRGNALAAVIQCMSKVLTIPLTVKTRTGVITDKNIAHTLVPKFREWGASLITIHGRSREQRYTKSADWPYIEQCAKIASPLPLFLNGDILSFEDYERAREQCPTVAGTMVGRGALIKPWIFTEIKERRHWDISSAERLDILKKYVNYGLEHWGSDTKGVENTRKFLLEWLSFLYRYIPIGILEDPPQRINDRPPFYRGRDELETLMASNNCADWIKISEMLLGPVPDQFNFLPKHKANSWK